MHYSSRKGKINSKGDWKIIQATPLTTGPRLRAASSLVSELWCQRGGPLLRYGGDTATPVSLGSRASNQRGFFSSLKSSWNLSCQHVDLLGIHLPFFPSNFSRLEWECLSYTCPTIVFRKYIIFLVSQVHSCRGILLQIKSYSKSHLILIFK